MSCSVPCCTSRTLRKGVKGEVSFHTFPNIPELREAWIKAIGRKDWEPNQYARVCSKHFEESCFISAYKIRKLTSYAVPTIFEKKSECEESKENPELSGECHQGSTNPRNNVTYTVRNIGDRIKFEPTEEDEKIQVTAEEDWSIDTMEKFAAAYMKHEDLFNTNKNPEKFQAALQQLAQDLGCKYKGLASRCEEFRARLFDFVRRRLREGLLRRVPPPYALQAAPPAITHLARRLHLLSPAMLVEFSDGTSPWQAALRELLHAMARLARAHCAPRAADPARAPLKVEFSDGTSPWQAALRELLHAMARLARAHCAPRAADPARAPLKVEFSDGTSPWQAALRELLHAMARLARAHCAPRAADPTRAPLKVLAPAAALWGCNIKSVVSNITWLWKKLCMYRREQVIKVVRSCVSSAQSLEDYWYMADTLLLCCSDADMNLVDTGSPPHKQVESTYVVLVRLLSAVRSDVKRADSSTTPRDPHCIRLWGRVLHAYKKTGRAGTAVLLQRVWHQLRAAARAALLAAPAPPAPAPLNPLFLLVAKLLPHAILQKVEPWSELVRTNRVVTDEDLPDPLVDDNPINNYVDLSDLDPKNAVANVAKIQSYIQNLLHSDEGLTIFHNKDTPLKPLAERIAILEQSDFPSCVNKDKVENKTDKGTDDEDDVTLKDLQKIKLADAKVSIIINDDDDDESLNSLVIDETVSRDSHGGENSVPDRKTASDDNVVVKMELKTKFSFEDDENMEVELIDESSSNVANKSEDMKFISFNWTETRKDSVELDEKIVSDAIVILERIDETDAFKRHFTNNRINVRQAGLYTGTDNLTKVKTENEFDRSSSDDEHMLLSKLKRRKLNDPKVDDADRSTNIISNIEEMDMSEPHAFDIEETVSSGEEWTENSSSFDPYKKKLLRPTRRRERPRVREARKVELPQIDEVLWNNKSALTAQVVPVRRNTLQSGKLTSNSEDSNIGTYIDHKQIKKFQEEFTSLVDPEELMRLRRNQELPHSSTIYPSLSLGLLVRSIHYKFKRRFVKPRHKVLPIIEAALTTDNCRKKCSNGKHDNEFDDLNSCVASLNALKEWERQKNLNNKYFTLGTSNLHISNTEKDASDPLEAWEAQKKYFGMDEPDETSTDEMTESIDPEILLKEQLTALEKDKEKKEPKKGKKAKKNRKDTKEQPKTSNPKKTKKKKPKETETIECRNEQIDPLEQWEREKNKNNKYFSIGVLGKSKKDEQIKPPKSVEVALQLDKDKKDRAKIDNANVSTHNNNPTNIKKVAKPVKKKSHKNAMKTTLVKSESETVHKKLTKPEEIVKPVNEDVDSDVENVLVIDEPKMTPNLNTYDIIEPTKPEKIAQLAQQDADSDEENVLVIDIPKISPDLNTYDITKPAVKMLSKPVNQATKSDPEDLMIVDSPKSNLTEVSTDSHVKSTEPEKIAEPVPKEVESSAEEIVIIDSPESDHANPSEIGASTEIIEIDETEDIEVPKISDLISLVLDDREGQVDVAKTTGPEVQSIDMDCNTEDSDCFMADSDLTEEVLVYQDNGASSTDFVSKEPIEESPKQIQGPTIHLVTCKNQNKSPFPSTSIGPRTPSDQQSSGNFPEIPLYSANHPLRRAVRELPKDTTISILKPTISQQPVSLIRPPVIRSPTKAVGYSMRLIQGRDQNKAGAFVLNIAPVSMTLGQKKPTPKPPTFRRVTPKDASMVIDKSGIPPLTNIVKGSGRKVVRLSTPTQVKVKQTTEWMEPGRPVPPTTLSMEPPLTFEEVDFDKISTIIRLDSYKPLWRIAYKFLVLTETVLPIDNPTYWTADDPSRRILLPDANINEINMNNKIDKCIQVGKKIVSKDNEEEKKITGNDNEDGKSLVKNDDNNKEDSRNLIDNDNQEKKLVDKSNENENSKMDVDSESSVHHTAEHSYALKTDNKSNTVDVGTSSAVDSAPSQPKPILKVKSFASVENFQRDIMTRAAKNSKIMTVVRSASECDSLLQAGAALWVWEREGGQLSALSAPLAASASPARRSVLLQHRSAPFLRDFAAHLKRHKAATDAARPHAQAAASNVKKQVKITTSQQTPNIIDEIVEID